MPLLGAHQSIAGGLYKAVDRAAACGCQCVQLFTGNPRAFSTKRPTSRSDKEAWLLEIQRFQDALKNRRISHPIAHDSYLINLASPDRTTWRRSVAAFVEELRRADSLGIPYVVTHPGAYTSGTEEQGLQNIIRAIDEIDAQTEDLHSRCLLETTAGQGTSLGWRFEHFGRILDGVQKPDRLGLCFDTCHVFAAGHAMGTRKEYRATMTDLDRLVGLDRIKAFHLNDSLRPLGSRVDRHEHIGRGHLGIEPFRFLLNDRRFRKAPMYLETPKGRTNGVDWDVINLELLRKLQSKVPSPSGRGLG